MPESDQQTHRSPRYATAVDDVTRPAWAQDIAVGDTVHVDLDGDVSQYQVAGFSTLKAYYGQPVIVPDARLQDRFDSEVGSVALREQDIVPAEEVAIDAE